MAKSPRQIYLDNNATTPLFPEVLARMNACWQSAFANPGSQHHEGRAARAVLEDSRESIAQCLGAEPEEVIFTSGGTESINMAIHGITAGRSGLIALTAGEHPATTQAVQRCCALGFETVTLHVDAQGQLRADQFDDLPWEQLRLVCVILAHNETGVIQDVTRLSQLCAAQEVPLLLDAVQAVGKIPVSFHELGATALAFGAHKFHGPRGIGGLLVRRGTRMPPLLEGGHQESGRRAGTEPVPLIAGMATALELFHREAESRMSRVAVRRNLLERILIERCQPVVIHGESADRLPNTLSIAFPGISGESLLVNLHLQGVACSLGSTCASGSSQAAPALVAMGLSEELCHSSVRFSLSAMNSSEDIEHAADVIADVVTRLRANSGKG